MEKVAQQQEARSYFCQARFPIIVLVNSSSGAIIETNIFCAPAEYLPVENFQSFPSPLRSPKYVVKNFPHIPADQIFSTVQKSAMSSIMFPAPPPLFLQCLRRWEGQATCIPSLCTIGIIKFYPTYSVTVDFLPQDQGFMMLVRTGK